MTCKHSHDPPDPACLEFLEGAVAGQCVYCDHAEVCHPGTEKP